MIMNLIRGLVAALTVIGVSQISERLPRVGAIFLALPTISVLAFAATWAKDQNLGAIQRLSQETLMLVPLGLPFFVPLAFADRLGIGFWGAMCSGLVLASAFIGVWCWIGPNAT
jgi:hypothetical protein